MARKDPPEEPLLFDLPMGKAGGDGQRQGLSGRSSPRKSDPRASGQELLRPLDLPLDETSEGQVDDLRDPAEVDFVTAPAPRNARFLAGFADLVMHAAVAVLGVIGARQVGVRPIVADWPGFALFLVAFSFLYVVVSLAFWGHTLGMVWAGVTSRSRDGDALSFDQAVRRWLGGILSAALLGLPLLFALRGRSLSDLLSSTETLGR